MLPQFAFRLVGYLLQLQSHDIFHVLFGFCLRFYDPATACITHIFSIVLKCVKVTYNISYMFISFLNL